MKRIIIEYDEQSCNLNVRGEGFTDAEMIVVMKESQGKLEQSVIDNLKKKKISLASPFSTVNIPKA
jgi:hypothetical protein